MFIGGMFPMNVCFITHLLTWDEFASSYNNKSQKYGMNPCPLAAGPLVGVSCPLFC